MISPVGDRPAPDQRLVAAITVAAQSYLNQEAAPPPRAGGARGGSAWKLATRNPSFETPAIRALSWRGR